MNLGAAINKAAIEWQFILFSFNQHQIEEASQLAQNFHIKFTVLKNGRFKSDDSLLADIKRLPETLKKKLAMGN